MRKSNALMLLVVSLLLITTSQMPGCSHEDSAFVTIHLKGTVEEAFRYQKENHSILAKVISWLLPNAHAGASPHTYTYDSIKLIVEGPDMETIEASIPITSLSYTVEVPAGSDRVFTAIAYNGAVKNSGASESITLQSGEAKALQLNMLPIIQGFSVSGTGSIEIYWNAVLNVQGYKIYRATAADGPYTMIQQITDYTAFHYTDTASSGTYYYKMRVYTSTKDGVLCDYKQFTKI